MENFNIALKSELEKLNDSAYSEFKTALCSILNKNAPIIRYFCGPPRKKVYRSYKNFDLENFNIALKCELEKLNDSAYNEFKTAFCSILNKNAPIKVKMLRYNNISFTAKSLTKTIMHRSKSKNRFNKRRTYEKWCN